MIEESPPDVPNGPDDGGRTVELFSWKVIPLLVVTGVVLWLILRHIAGVDNFWETVRGAEPAWLVLAAAMMAFNLVVASVRLKWILETTGHEVPLGRSFEAVLGTWPIALLTPSRAGDLARAYLLRDLVPAVKGSGAVIAEKVIDVQSLCILATIGSIVSQQWLFAAFTAAMLLGVWSVLLGLRFFTETFLGLPLVRRFESKFRQLLSAMNALSRQRGPFLAISSISMVGWIVAVSIIAALMMAFGADVPLTSTFGLWPIALFAGMLPLTVAGMGTRDAAFVSMLVLALGSVDESAVLAATLSYALVTAWVPGLLTLPVMLKAFGTR